jgi:NADPH:quinone reductase-like Zn-dependent oxidoreductase
MRAARIHAYGGPEVLSIDADVPEPTPGPGAVLVEVHATSVNPIDCKIRQGAFRAALRYRLPRTLGMDVSGVVVGVGAGVTRWKIGDAVIASPGPKTPGSYAELTTVRAGELGRKPANLSHVEAASLPLAYLTAWQALAVHGRVQRGERVLVQAGAGGVGTLAIQVAKHLGAWVATTCSAPNRALVSGLGADQVIDYRSEDYTEVLRDLDVVLDALGLDEVKRARKVVRRGGRIVGISVGLPERVARYGKVWGLIGTGFAMAQSVIGARMRSGVKARYFTRAPSGAQLDQLAELCEAGVIRPVVERVYPLAEIAEAHRHSDSGRARGKLVIAVR